MGKDQFRKTFSAPGPGQYDIIQQIGADSPRKTISPRYSESDAKGKLPGPGYYENDPIYIRTSKHVKYEYVKIEGLVLLKETIGM
jgi:hypothetical protein